VLEVKSLSKTFLKGTVNEHRALSHINLTLKRGEFVTVIGSNGAGKSTLFNAIAGAFYPDEGTVHLDGKDITYEKEYKRASSIGRLFQNPLQGTAPDMTVEENLALAYHRQHGNPFRLGIHKRDVNLFGEQLAGFHMGLQDRLKAKVGLLSGGQRQALSLLMSTISKPKLLLLDEHTAALDPSSAEQVMALTREIIDHEGITAIMITHDIKLALDTGTRTIMLDRGHIALDVEGERRRRMEVKDVVELFHKTSGQVLACDSMLLSN